METFQYAKTAVRIVSNMICFYYTRVNLKEQNIRNVNKLSVVTYLYLCIQSSLIMHHQH